MSRSLICPAMVVLMPRPDQKYLLGAPTEILHALTPYRRLVARGPVLWMLWAYCRCARRTRARQYGRKFWVGPGNWLADCCRPMRHRRTPAMRRQSSVNRPRLTTSPVLSAVAGYCEFRLMAACDARFAAPLAICARRQPSLRWSFNRHGLRRSTSAIRRRAWRSMPAGWKRSKRISCPTVKNC